MSDKEHISQRLQYSQHKAMDLNKLHFNKYNINKCQKNIG